MRDLDRIGKFLYKIQDRWIKYFPDWRFGQLMINFLGWAADKYGDPFFWEEDKFIEYFDEFINSGNSPFKKPEE